MNQDMQLRYWNRLTQYKFEIIYYQLCFSKYVMLNRWIVCFLAIISSGAVGIQIFTKELNWLWTGIVVIAQALSVINVFLPYGERIKEIPKMVDKMNDIYNDMENQWYKISIGEIENAEINAILYSYIEKWDKIFQKYLCSDAIPIDNRLVKKAGDQKESYFKNVFGGTLENE